jgi:hypothetical protein
MLGYLTHGPFLPRVTTYETQFVAGEKEECKPYNQGHRSVPLPSGSIGGPPGAWEKRHCVTIFTTYLDASRDNAGSGVYSLAGYIAAPSQWDRFSYEWRGILDEYEIKSFHMTDFEGWDESAGRGFGEFRRWTKDDPRRLPLLTKLLAVIERNVIGSVGYAVSQAMYDEIVPPEVNSAVGGSPYFFLFLNLLIGAQDLMDNAAKFAAGVPYDWMMTYMLARGDVGAGEVVKTWMSKNPGSRQARIDAKVAKMEIAKNNSLYLPLEAADILAYEGRKQVSAQLGQHSRPSRRSFMVMEDSRRPKSWHFYEDPIQLRLNVETVRRALTDDQSDTIFTWV